MMVPPIPRLIAHRGAWWPRFDQQNSPAALAKVLQRGWGVELDLSHDGVGWCIQHGDGPAWALEDALAAFTAGEGPILWNVKSPGAEAILPDVYARACSSLRMRSYVFDHELVDPMLPSRLPLASYLMRVNDAAEWARVPHTEHAGYWLDCAGGAWADPDTFGAAAHRIFLVSPELHGHPIDLGRVRAWLDAGAWVCTDMPHLFASPYDPQQRQHLEPADPWWE